MGLMMARKDEEDKLLTQDGILIQEKSQPAKKGSRSP
jgi:hypothetical protein